jgi:hypothetical protein
MKTYTYSEARENFATVLEQNETALSKFVGETAQYFDYRPHQSPSRRLWTSLV